MYLFRNHFFFFFGVLQFATAGLLFQNDKHCLVQDSFLADF